MQPFFKISSKIEELSEKAMELSAASFAEIERTTEYNQLKMLSSFVQNGVSESHFVTSTGYGYDDRGRETLEQVFAQASALRTLSFATLLLAALIRSQPPFSACFVPATQCFPLQVCLTTQFIPLSVSAERAWVL